MPTCRTLFPRDIGEGIVAALERAAADRNELVVRKNDAKGKIGVTYQTDDPAKPDIFKIDVDAPAPKDCEAKDIFLARLEIHTITGEMKFYPSGCPTPEEIHPIGSHHAILERMIETVWSN